MADENNVKMAQGLASIGKKRKKTNLEIFLK